MGFLLSFGIRGNKLECGDEIQEDDDEENDEEEGSTTGTNEQHDVNERTPLTNGSK